MEGVFVHSMVGIYGLCVPGLFCFSLHLICSWDERDGGGQGEEIGTGM